MSLLRFFGTTSLLAAAAVGVASVACGDDARDVPLACLDAGVDPATCTPAYPATYDAILASTFRPRCASPDCHGGATPKGDLSFDDADAAYHVLLRDSVTAGEPSCSDLVLRVTDTASAYVMPPTPAEPLDAGERCAIAQWVARGAAR